MIQTDMISSYVYEYGVMSLDSRPDVHDEGTIQRYVLDLRKSKGYTTYYFVNCANHCQNFVPANMQNHIDEFIVSQCTYKQNLFQFKKAKGHLNNFGHQK